MTRKLIAIGALAVVLLLSLAQFGPSLVRGETAQAASPIFGVTIPPGYRVFTRFAR